MKRVIIVSLLFFVASSVFALVEEEALVSESILKYSLSNDPKEIEQAIKARTGYTVFLDNHAWVQNPALNQSVKDLMIKHKVNYSMTTYLEGYNPIIIVNRYFLNNWYLIALEATRK